jgi:hypothetical protein
VRRAVVVTALVVTLGGGLWTTPVQATTIVAFRSDERIILATDSAALGLDDRTFIAGTIDCKVQPSGQFWTLYGGFMASDGLDLREVIGQRIANAKTMTEALNAIEEEYRKRLRALLASKSRLFEHRRPGEPVMVVIVAGQGTLGMFRVTVKQQEPFDVVEASETHATGVYYNVASHPSPVIDQFLKSPLPSWFRRADATAARRFIEMQIRETPDKAKAPIDVLELTPDGRARWIDRDPSSACPEISVASFPRLPGVGLVALAVAAVVVWARRTWYSRSAEGSGVGGRREVGKGPTRNPNAPFTREVHQHTKS